MSGVANLFGENVYDKEGKRVDLKARCAGKIVGIYVSAHWCPASRRFTPKLAKFYKAYHDARNFEIIFVSDVIYEDEFKKFYGEMPWLVLAFEQRQMEVIYAFYNSFFFQIF
jgi:thiol-disulfide isomerase/thioredoxin